jgi:hypothetical protein
MLTANRGPPEWSEKRVGERKGKGRPGKGGGPWGTKGKVTHRRRALDHIAAIISFAGLQTEPFTSFFALAQLLLEAVVVDDLRSRCRVLIDCNQSKIQRENESSDGKFGWRGKGTNGSFHFDAP